MEWDQAVDAGTEEDRIRIRNKMLDLLNRRNYLRNLVRDVTEVLES
jgi:molecular chaperone HscB